jgi:MYXO-CTERM domain-containing protein
MICGGQARPRGRLAPSRLALGLALGLATSRPAAAADPPLSAQPTQVALGDVSVLPAGNHATASVSLIAGAVGATITAMHLDGGAVTAWSFTTTCGATPTTTGACTLAAGAAATVTFTAAPTAAGSLDASLLITLGGLAPGQTVTIPLHAVGVGATLTAVAATPATVSLGAVPLGATSTPATIVVRNGGNLAATATVTTTGPFAAQPATLAVDPLTTAAVAVTCTPTAAGPATGTLTITSHNAYLGSPLSLPLTCAGAAGYLRATPTTVDLGELRVGAPPRRTTITLAPTAATTITALELTPAVPGLSLEGPTLPAAIAAGGALTVDVVAAPAADGDLTAALAITTADPADALAVPIHGLAVTAHATTPPLVDFGTICTTGAPPPLPIDAWLDASGTATLVVQPPTLDGAPFSPGAMSPFHVALAQPASYPTAGYMLPAGERATATLSTDIPTAPGVYTDTLRWATDLGAGTPTTTKVALEVLSTGGAISPSVVDFGVAPTNSVSAPRMIVVQNCGAADVTLQTASIAAPFSTRGLPLPLTLAAGGQLGFRVVFAPAIPGRFEAPLTLALTGAAQPTLTVDLIGQTAEAPVLADGGLAPAGHGHGCGCRTDEAPTGPLLLGLLGAALSRRRGRVAPR